LFDGTIVNANRRTKTEVGVGTRLVQELVEGGVAGGGRGSGRGRGCI